MKKIIIALLCSLSVIYSSAQEFDSKVRFVLRSNDGRQINSKNESVGQLPTPVIFNISFDHNISAYTVMVNKVSANPVLWFSSTNQWETTFLDKGDICYSISGIFRMEGRDNLQSTLRITYNTQKLEYSYLTFNFQSGAYILFDELNNIKQ